tara:strand:- start:759 stop:1337 length:579 start_codon:yes stop_codon:yes gene_type:complete
MPWKYNGSTLRPGKAFTGTDGTKYPAVWMRYSNSEKTAMGITWEDPPASEAPYDNRFYSGRQTDGTLIPRSLTDINEVDEDGNAIIDTITGKQFVTKGLKTIYIEQTKQTANDKLSETDWYVTRKAEDSTTTIPSEVTTYRAAVRTKSGTIETAINNAANFTAFMALFDVPVDSDGNPTGDNAPINDWPDEL